MSSLSVRNLVKDFLSANSNESVIDLTGDFQELNELLTESDVQPESPWLGITFEGDSEEPVSLAADNTKGLYRESGLIQLHICAVGRIGVGNELITRSEVLRNLFRGRRIGALVVENVSPIATGPGATLEFEGGYVSGTITIAYHFDITPGT